MGAMHEVDPRELHRTMDSTTLQQAGGEKTEIGQEEDLARHATARVIGDNRRPTNHPTTTALGTGVGVHGYDPGYMGSVHGSPASRGGTHG